MLAITFCWIQETSATPTFSTDSLNTDLKVRALVSLSTLLPSLFTLPQFYRTFMDYSRSPKAIALPTLDGATRRFRFPDSIEGVSHNGQHVLIIGGGVTGLTLVPPLSSCCNLLYYVVICFSTAWVLLDAGYSVTIISERWAPATPPITSQIGSLSLDFTQPLTTKLMIVFEAGALYVDFRLD